MRNDSPTDLNRANYGIDGPIVLRNLILIGIGAIIIERRKREEAIHEISRVLKPGGWIGIIDSFQYAGIFKKMGWENIHASGVRLKMFPPVKWTTGKKPINE